MINNNSILYKETLDDLINNQINEEKIIKIFTEILNENITNPSLHLSLLLAHLQHAQISDKLISSMIRIIFKNDTFHPYRLKKCSSSSLICVAGSGKKYYPLMNITTIGTFLAYALGATIIKPVSLGITSHWGSYDLLKHLSIQVANNFSEAEDHLDKIGIAYISIENAIPKFNSLYEGNQFTISPLSYALPALMTEIYCPNIYYGLATQDTEKSIRILRNFGINGNIGIANTAFNNKYIDELLSIGNSSLLCNYAHNSISQLSENRKITIENNYNYSYTALLSSNDSQQKQEINDILFGKSTNWAYIDAISLASAGILHLSKEINFSEAYRQSKEYLLTGKLIQTVNFLRENHK